MNIQSPETFVLATYATRMESFFLGDRSIFAFARIARKFVVIINVVVAVILILTHRTNSSTYFKVEQCLDGSEVPHFHC